MHINVITKLKKFRITIHNKSNYTNKWEEKLPIFSGNIHKNAKEDQMDPLIIFWLLFGFYLSSTAWDLYLTLRQVLNYDYISSIEYVTTIMSQENWGFKMDGLLVSITIVCFGYFWSLRSNL